MSTSVLYISYTGILQPLGQSQVCAYLSGLAKEHRIVLLSYERSDDLDDTRRLREALQTMQDAGIEWRYLRYHKRPPLLATLYDIGRGIWTSLWLARRERVEIVHCRSYVPAVIGLMLKRILGTSFLFDMRGFWADERVDGGIWARSSPAYRVAKWCEQRFLLAADGLVSLTQAGVDSIRAFEYFQRPQLPIAVIPTCTDLDRFQPVASPRPAAAFTLGYLGSVGSWYLFDEVLQGYAALRRRRPDARLLIVNRGEEAFIRAKIAQQGLTAEPIEIVSVDYDQVPALIRQMDAGIFFIKPCFSKRASAPTRMGEFLACGVPVLANAGVGDVAAVLQGTGAGICVDNFSRKTLAAAAQELVALTGEPDIKQRCRSVAEHQFSLQQGTARYAALYAQLLRLDTGAAP